MSEEKEQNKEKISSALHGGSIKAENITIIQNHGSTFGQNSSFASKKGESTDSLKTKKYPLWAACITGVAAIIGGVIIGLPHWDKDNRTGTQNITMTQIQTTNSASPTNSIIQHETNTSPVLNNENPTPQHPSGFKAGTYREKSQDLEYTVDGPSPQGSRAGWSISSSDGSFSAKWLTGPKAGHPDIAGYNSESLLGEGVTYGRVGSVDLTARENRFKNWKKGRVIGVLQTGNKLVITQYINERQDETLTVSFQK